MMYYRSGRIDFDSYSVNFSDSIPYGPGISNSISLNNEGDYISVSIDTEKGMYYMTSIL